MAILHKSHSLTGFTLIELMVAVAIMAILASMAVPFFTNAIEAAREKEAKTTLEIIYTAQKNHKLDNGVYFDGFSANVGNGMYGYLDNPNVNSKYYDFSVTCSNASADFTATAIRKTDSSKRFKIDQNGNFIQY